MQQALEVIEGTDGVVTQHLVELLGNGVSLPGKDEGPSELRARAFQPWPSSSQHTHTPSHGKFPQGPLAKGKWTARMKACGVGFCAPGCPAWNLPSPQTDPSLL